MRKSLCWELVALSACTWRNLWITALICSSVSATPFARPTLAASYKLSHIAALLRISPDRVIIKAVITLKAQLRMYFLHISTSISPLILIVNIRTFRDLCHFCNFCCRSSASLIPIQSHVNVSCWAMENPHWQSHRIDQRIHNSSLPTRRRMFSAAHTISSPE